VLPDIEIAQQARLKRISALALERLGIPEENLEPYGHYKAKISLEYLDSLKGRPDGKLILVTAISPRRRARARPPPRWDWATRSTASARKR